MTDLPPPLTDVDVNTFASLQVPMIRPTGFREYDGRWRFPEDINLEGVQALGLGFATQMHAAGGPATVAVGNDYRAYAPAIKQAFIVGLMAGGAEVFDIGTALSPLAYFAQIDLGTHGVAMITASHNPNGWTGVKLGMEQPLTHGPEAMAELRDIVLAGRGRTRAGGRYTKAPEVAGRYIDDLVADGPISRPLRVVCAAGNGAAGAYAPEMLTRLGCEVIPLHCTPDYTFPHYNPNPEAMEMLHDMAEAVRTHGADLAVGFDGDGDRCGVVDETGDEIFSDKVGLILARDIVTRHPQAVFVADVKSTGLFIADPVLAEHDARTYYWRTGHSHMKRRVAALGALAGFEKAGHYIFAPPIGRGYDCGLRAAVEICRLLDRTPESTLSALHRALPRTWATPTLAPWCADEEKYAVAERLTARLVRMASEGADLAGHRISDVVTVNGARVQLDHGGWALVRPSSNTPNLVVVCESPESETDLRAIFAAIDTIVRTEPSVGAYDQAF